MNQHYTVSGNIVDLIHDRIYQGTLHIDQGIITEIKDENVDNQAYIIPGFIDAHIHIESSMLIPSEFARLAVIHGTVGTVSDPHEIANVLGIEGVQYMIRNGKKVPFKFNFGASSCVPATVFETAGAELGVQELEKLLKLEDIKYMSEMMNWPGVLYGDQLVYDKLALAKKYKKPIDGHAPGVMGEDAKKYIEAGISTDHECFTLKEAQDKLKYGMKIIIREGSAAKNFEALSPLIENHADMLMFCSDDRHPNDLVKEHINELVRRSIAKGFDPLVVLKIASVNPVKHYGLNIGLLRKGDPADFIIVNNLKEFQVISTFINGIKVADQGKTLIEPIKESVPNRFDRIRISTEELAIPSKSENIKVIEALDGQLITHELVMNVRQNNGLIQSDPENDILKLVVVNRYANTPPALAFIKNFGLKSGAIASSVAHDSHNVIAVGVTDSDITRAVNLLIDSKGGVSLTCNNHDMVVELPVAGLMSNRDGFDIAKAYEEIDQQAKKMGSKLQAPYMTLSFMALLVIPEIKLSDKGLFDGKKFEFTSIFSD